MKDIVIYTVDYCPYCKKAELLLNDKGVKFKKIDITSNEAEYRKKIGEYYDIAGEVTVPQIIIDGKRIGGFDDLNELNATGDLDKLLEI
jgi:GrxC family glutaredoxin